MSNQIHYKNQDQVLQEFLDSSYTVSHSSTAVNAHKSGVVGKTNGFRQFLKNRYDCDEIQLSIKIQNEEIDVYQVLRN